MKIKYFKIVLPIILQFIILCSSLLLWALNPDGDIKMWVFVVILSVLFFLGSTIIYVLLLMLIENDRKTNFVINKIINTTIDENSNLVLICKDINNLYNINSMASVYETTKDEVENFLCTGIVINKTIHNLVYFQLILNTTTSEYKEEILENIKKKEKNTMKNLLIKPTVSYTTIERE